MPVLVENQKFSKIKYRRLLVVLVGILELPGGVRIRVVHRLLLVRVVDEIVLLCGGLRSALKRDMAKNLIIYRDWYRPLPVYWQAVPMARLRQIGKQCCGYMAFWCGSGSGS